MTAALVRRLSTSQSLADWRTARLLADASFNPGSKFHYDGPAAEKLPGPKPTATVLVLGMDGSPRSADRRWRRVETVDTGVIVDTRYNEAAAFVTQ